MCGRITLASKVSDLLDLIDFDIEFLNAGIPSRFNIAPTQPVLAIRADPDHPRPIPVLLRWGLVPFWADDIKIGSRMINARSETVAEKPSFRAAFKYRRCIIPIDGFYEWHQSPGSKIRQPYWIHRPERQPMALAGLWESWDKDGSGPLETCTILTTTANRLMSQLHERMPVILDETGIREWLNTAPPDSSQLQSLLKPAYDGLLKARPVSNQVNSPLNDGPELIHATGPELT